MYIYLIYFFDIYRYLIIMKIYLFKLKFQKLYEYQFSS